MKSTNFLILLTFTLFSSYTKGVCLKTILNDISKNSENSILSFELMDKNASSMKNRHKRYGEPITLDVLDKLEVDPLLYPFFRRDGSFVYHNEKPLHLSLENGDEKLKLIRMNWINIDESINLISKSYLEELSKIALKDPDFEIVVSTNEKDLRSLRKFIRNLDSKVRKQITILSLNKTHQLNLWPQDSGKPIKGGEVDSLLSKFEMSFDETLQAVDSSRLLRYKESLFFFEGGNVIVGSEHIFVGENVIKTNIENLGISYNEVVDSLSKEFSKPVIIIPQIDYHIDLTMAVVRNKNTNKDEILLASSSKARELLSGFKYEDLVTDGEEDFKTFLDYVDDYPNTIEQLSIREKKLKGLKNYLGELGYKVKDVPDLSLIDDHALITSEKKIDSFENRSPSAFNYTNSIFSNDYALVPQTGIRVFDTYVKDIIEKQGREYIPMVSGQHSICFMGGIRCLSETHRKGIDKKSKGKIIKSKHKTRRGMR